MQKLTLALLSGGISSEREVSLNSGKQVYEALDKEKYDIIQYDPKTDLPKLVADAAKIDVALVILHGPYGEDGTVQGLLDLLSIPYQGAGVLGSAVAMNKLVSKQLYHQAGLPVPPYVVFHDATLKEMLAQRPMSRMDLLTITGVGQSKLDKFGSEFIDVICRHAEASLG